MGWLDDDGQKVDNIYATGIVKITNFEYYFIRITFPEDMDIIHVNSVMHYTRNGLGGDFRIVSFIYYLMDRGTPFTTEFIWLREEPLKLQYSAFKLYCLVQWYIFKKKWRGFIDDIKAKRS